MPRLFVLDFGLIEVSGTRRGIPGYLIRTEGGENILVDTGWSARYGVDAGAAMLADGYAGAMRPVSITAENMLPAQLARAGVVPGDLDLLVLTHSDVDHIGGIGFVPESVPVVVSRAERDAPPRYAAVAAWPEREYRLVEGDLDVRPGVRLLMSPGHSVGHLSLFVRLAGSGPVVLAIDAISNASELEGEIGGWDAAIARASADRLAALADVEGAMVVFGHDEAQWPTLRKAPAFYD